MSHFQFELPHVSFSFDCLKGVQTLSRFRITSTHLNSKKRKYQCQKVYPRSRLDRSREMRGTLGPFVQYLITGALNLIISNKGLRRAYFTSHR